MDATTLIEFAGTLEGQTLRTEKYGREFTVSAEGDRLRYRPLSTGNLRPERAQFIQQTLDRFEESRTYRPIAYRDITRNASYTLAILKRYYDDRSSRG